MRWLLVTAALLGVAACSPQPDATGCRKADGVVLERLQGELKVEGELRNGFTSTRGGTTLVSAELRLADDPASKKGDVLTFASTDGSFAAVDRYARSKTSLPEAPFDVRGEGVYASRACAAANRGD